MADYHSDMETYLSMKAIMYTMTRTGRTRMSTFSITVLSFTVSHWIGLCCCSLWRSPTCDLASFHCPIVVHP